MNFPRNFFLILLTLFTIQLNAQENNEKIRPVYGIDSNAVYTILHFIGVDFHRYELSSSYADYYCDLQVIEFRNGVAVDSNSARKKIGKFDFALSVSRNLDNGKFRVELYSQPMHDSLLKLYAVIGGAGYHLVLNILPRQNYSWKEVYDMENKKHIPEPGIFFPLLAYTTPIGEKYQAIPGTAEFCRINGERIHFRQWYSELGIEHYYIAGIYLQK